MARSLKIEQFSTKKAEKLLKDIPRQTEIFERTLDFITNVINGAITLIIIYIVYYEWEEQGKEEEKLKKQEMIDQFKQIQGTLQNSDFNFHISNVTGNHYLQSLVYYDRSRTHLVDRPSNKGLECFFCRIFF